MCALLVRVGLALARAGGWSPLTPWRLARSRDTWEADEPTVARELLMALGPLAKLPPESAALSRIEDLLYVTRTTTEEATDRAGRINPIRLAYNTGLRDAYGLLVGLYHQAEDTLRERSSNG